MKYNNYIKIRRQPHQYITFIYNINSYNAIYNKQAKYYYIRKSSLGIIITLIRYT